MHYLILPSTADSLTHCHPGLCRSLPDVLVSIFSLNSSQIDNHVVEDEQKKWLVRKIHSISSTSMKNTKYSIHDLASSCISSPREVAPVSSCEIFASVSLLDSVWQNLSDSIVMESTLSSKGQFASSKLNINCDTWATHKSAMMGDTRKHDDSLQ